MKRLFSSGLIICAGVVGITVAAAHADADITQNRKKFDLREAILRRFFRENHCPAESYAGVFISEADAAGLDWRLLPSLSFVESGGGQHARGNNLFGWANGVARFESITQAIHHVADTLAFGKAYRGKDLTGKLSTYNHQSGYRETVMRVMRRIAPSSEIAFEVSALPVSD